MKTDPPASRRTFIHGATALLAGSVTATSVPALAQAQPAGTTPANRALFTITENDPARWNLVLGNMHNLREGVSPDSVEIELVAFGPGLWMLRSETAVKQRVLDVMAEGCRVSVCQNTMRAMHLAPSDMMAEVGYVPAGVVEVMRRQQQGWAYIRS
ncbi:hypothetical protein BH10PSE17_BH10PSE17_32540 [soil metagenome]